MGGLGERERRRLAPAPSTSPMRATPQARSSPTPNGCSPRLAKRSAERTTRHRSCLDHRRRGRAPRRAAHWALGAHPPRGGDPVAVVARHCRPGRGDHIPSDRGDTAHRTRWRSIHRHPISPTSPCPVMIGSPPRVRTPLPGRLGPESGHDRGNHQGRVRDRAVERSRLSAVCLMHVDALDQEDRHTHEVLDSDSGPLPGRS